MREVLEITSMVLMIAVSCSTFGTLSWTAMSDTTSWLLRRMLQNMTINKTDQLPSIFILYNAEPKRRGLKMNDNSCSFSKWERYKYTLNRNIRFSLITWASGFYQTNRHGHIHEKVLYITVHRVTVSI